MEISRVILAVLFPPLAVYDKGCGTMFLVGLLTVFGYFPGLIAALLIVSSTERDTPGDRRFVEIPNSGSFQGEPEKRKGAYVRLVDGEIAEVIEGEDAEVVKRKRGE
jgi:uncharacterized membrane protein YqaE (UPF0057 family)